MTAPIGSEIGHRSLHRGVDGIACAVSLNGSVGWGMASPAWGMDCLTFRHWYGVQVWILIHVWGQTRDSGAACTAVTILGRRCVLGAEPSKWFDSVCVELLGSSLQLSQSSANL